MLDQLSKMDVVTLPSQFCDCFLSLQTCGQPIIIMLKQGFCWILVRTNLLEMLVDFCQHLNGGIGVFFPLGIISTRITSSDDSDHDLAP